MLSIRPATPEDCRHVAATLRLGDARECEMFGVSALQAMETAMHVSIIGECILVDGEPAAVFGLHAPDILAGVGHPWLLTGDVIERRRIGYARTMRALVQRALDITPRLENVVDARYGRAVALLEWLGFSVEEPACGLRLFWKEKE